MKFNLLSLIFVMSVTFSFSQKTIWNKTTQTISNIKHGKEILPKNHVFNLDIESLKTKLINAPVRGKNIKKSNLIISFPNTNGKMERFSVFEASVMADELQARYPNIRSYAGQGLDDRTAIIRFSISPDGFQSMVISAKKEASFIEAITNDNNTYTVFKRSEKLNNFNDFECTTVETINKRIGGSLNKNANDGTLRSYRLAMSATGEYTNYFGGTKANALAAINATMTRVNGVYETDFNVTMILIANTDNVIYTNASSDPYSSDSNFNSEVQSTLTSVIGESNYDIGHLVHKGGNNGNAGCIGCVCNNGSKGSAYTSYSNPQGDNFDIDFVTHEIGHQFGANHTFTIHNEGTNAHFEPGSGSTIMGYAGITGATDVQNHSDPYFHWFSVQQVTDYVKSTSCQTNINTGNAVPTASAGSDYTVPKGTPFVLTGSGSDANSSDVLTYCWEQADENNAATKYPSTTATSGIAFRSYNPTTNTKRYFPRLATIKAGNTSWQWEAVPNVARTLNFRLTVRDNKAGGGNNNSDDMRVVVKSSAGPFVVNSPNTNVTWSAGSTKTVTWNVAGTTGNGINTANVDIFLSVDGGNTYPISLASNVSNDGSHNIIVPNNVGTQNRILIRGAGNIFFDISNTNFTITAGSSGSSYCASQGNSVSDEYIQRVQIGSINNASGSGNGYSDYTSISTNLTKGSSAIITITPKWTGTVYNEGYAVWIDYNKDGDFTDSGEQVWSKAASKTTPVSGTFTIPSSATTGNTRMRVSMKYNGIPSSCEAFDYGEVEDYTVNISVPTDIIAPVITLTGSTTINLNVGNTYNEQGATATDNVDGNLTSSIVVSGSVNTATAGTYYKYYNVSDAAGNIATQKTRTINVTALPTGCSGGITSYPYNESFENTLGAWSQASGDNFNWIVKSGSTPSSGTGPSSANNGTYYIYMESSAPNFSTKRAILNSPCFDLSNESQAALSFKYHMYGKSTMGSLALEASTNNGSTWASIWSKSGNQGNSWKTATIDLAAYVGETVKLRFNGVTGTTWQGDMAVDAFSISSGGSSSGCVDATLTINFDDYPAETSWDIKDNNGTVVFSGGTYASQAKRSTLVLSSCLPVGCYTFTMKDSYGDGMCCNYGSGSYSLTQNSNGSSLASGASFTNTDVTNFCVGTSRYSSSKKDIALALEVEIYPNPAKNSILVNLRDQKMKQYLITNMMGQNVLQGEISNKKIDVSILENGMYFIIFSSDKKQIVKRFIKN